MKMARLAVVFDREEAERRRKHGVNVFESYVGELLAHAGIPFEWADGVQDLARVRPDVALVAFAPDTPGTAEQLWAYAEQGGTVIGFSRMNGLAKKLGCIPLHPLSPGYAALPAAWGDTRPLRFLQAVPWRVTDACTALSERVGEIGRLPNVTDAGSALLRFRVGAGTIERWSIDLPNTIVGLQQGTKPVFEDGIPAPDGSGGVDEGILKADDAIEMDWELDRLTTSTGQPYFAHPYADLWKETLVGHLLRASLAKGLTLPFVGYWPEGVARVAMISHDSDHNEDEAGESTLALLRECGIRSTWCMIEPGYGVQVYDRVKADGHELGFHYNAIDYPWSKDEFARQFAWLKQAIGTDDVTSNKNHYTRLNGWGELFRWCESHGIRSDQTRGPSKRGNVGFPFGTCHPYFPIAWCDEGNRIYDVVEIGFLTQDMDIGSWADSSIIEPFLDQVALVDGIAHFLFHQYHIHRKEECREAFRTVVREAHKRGFVFWTGKEVNDWVRARRRVSVTGVEEGGVTVRNDAGLPGVVVWIPVPDGDPSATVTKFGVPCRKAAVRVVSEEGIASAKGL